MQNITNVLLTQVIGRNGGEDTLSHWPISVGIMTINEASCEVLKYLERIWSTLSSLGKYLPYSQVESHPLPLWHLDAVCQVVDI